MRTVSLPRNTLILVLGFLAFVSADAPSSAPKYSGNLYSVDGSPAVITINYSLVPAGNGKFSLDFPQAAVSADEKLVITSTANFGFAPDTGDLAVTFSLGSVKVPNSPPITGLKWDKKNQFTAKNGQLDPFAKWLVQTINNRQAGFDPTDPIPVPSLATFTITPQFGGKFPGIESSVEGYVKFVFQEVTPQGKVKSISVEWQTVAELKNAFSKVKVEFEATQLVFVQRQLAIASLPLFLPQQIAEVAKQPAISAELKASTAKLEEAATKLTDATVRAQTP